MSIQLRTIWQLVLALLFVALAAIALMVLVSPERVRQPVMIPVAAVFVLCLAVLMVSNLPYRSFKDLNLKRPRPARTLFVISGVTGRDGSIDRSARLLDWLFFVHPVNFNRHRKRDILRHIFPFRTHSEPEPRNLS